MNEEIEMKEWDRYFREQLGKQRGKERRRGGGDGGEYREGRNRESNKEFKGM